jgi:hypothetical protein
MEGPIMSTSSATRRARLKLVVPEPAETETIVCILRNRLRVRREVRIARERREAEHQKHAVWVDPEELAGHPHDLETALTSGQVRCRFQHVGRWWQWRDVPDGMWKAARNGARLIGSDGRSLVDSEQWVLRINQKDWRHVGGARREAAAPMTATEQSSKERQTDAVAPAPAAAQPTPETQAKPEEIPVEKKSNAGAPPQYDWEEASLYVGQLWKELGDPREPSNATDKWRTDLDIARRVADHLRIHAPAKEPPDPKYVADKLRPEIKKLRGQ